MKLLSASEVAERMSLSTRTVQDMLRRGVLPSCQVTPRRRMVPERALNTWIEQNTVLPDPSSTGSSHQPGMSSGAREAASVAALHERRTDTEPSNG
ncbi:MAG: helix-turn-helix domain-containing protein [Pseudomonadota bacterium]